MAVPYTFGNATTAIPLSQLDNNFATAITIGNTAVQLGNTVTTLNNMTMANVTISSVSTPITAAQGGTGQTSLTSESVVVGNGTNAVKFVAPGTNGNVLASNGTAWVSQAPAAASGNVTIGNTTINIGGTATTVGNLTLTNATISSVSTPITAAQGGTGLTTLTSNNVLIGNGTGSVAFVAPGTSGNVLSSDGSAWVSTTPAGGGSWIYLSTVTANNSATVDIETTFNSTYDAYKIIGVGITFDGTANFYARLKVGGSYQTANYYGSYIAGDSAGVGAINATGNEAYIFIAPQIQTGNSNPVYIESYTALPASTTVKKGLHTHGYGISRQNANAALQIHSGHMWTGSGNTAALTGVRYYANSGNIVTGTFRLYGIKNS